MQALPLEPVTRHPLGREIRLYMVYRVAATTLISLMLVLPQSVVSWGLAINSPASLVGFGYFFCACLLLAMSYLPFLQVRTHLFVGTAVDMVFALLVLNTLPEAIPVIGSLLLFTVASGALLVSPGFGALAATLAATVLVLAYADSEQGQATTGPYLIPLILAYGSISLLAGRIGQRITLATWTTSAQETEIAELSALNRQVLKRLPVGVLVVDAAGDIRTSNDTAAQLLQLPPQGERRSLALASPAIQRQLQAWADAPGAERKPVTLGPDARQVEPHFVPLHSGSGEVLVFLEDTSQANKRAESITLATLGRFSASLAHEIRNPLSAIRYSAQLLHESTRLDVMDRRMLDIIQQQTQRMNGIVDSVLGLARRERANPQDVDLGAMLQEFVSEYSAGFPLDNDTLALQLPPAPLRAHADPRHIHQILMVLVSNARYYGRMPEQPAHMTLQLRNDGTQLSINVLDRGPGIHPRVQDSLFRPFFTTSSHGTGLGLYIARELARANHGDLQYLARAHGSCFHLSLPHALRPG